MRSANSPLLGTILYVSHPLPLTKFIIGSATHFPTSPRLVQF